MFNRILYFLIFFTILLSFEGCNIFDDDNEDETIIRGKIIDKVTTNSLDSVLIQVYSMDLGITGPPEYEFYNESDGTFKRSIICRKDYSYSINTSKVGYIISGFEDYIYQGEDNYFLIEMIKDTTKTE